MKHIVLMASFCSIASPAHAEPELGVAFKGGPSAATLAEDYRVNRYGFAGGLGGHLRWPLADRFSFAGQIDLLYTGRGAEVNRDGEYLGKSRLNYLDITAAARPEVRLGPASIYLLLGGGLDVLVSASKDSASGVKEDITGDLRRIDVALLVGAGVALHLPGGGSGPLRFGAVFLEARHDHGLIDTDSVNGGFKNRTSSLMLGLAFALGSGAQPADPIPPPAKGEPATPAVAAVLAR